MKFRIVVLIGVMALALGLVGITLALAQDAAPVVHSLTESDHGNTAAASPTSAKTPILHTGSRHIIEPAVISPTISLIKTVGTDPNICATTTAITVTAGTSVTYCYEVTNTGSVTVTRHTLADSELGTILSDFSYSLVPAASAFITETAVITGTTVNTATWTAYNPGPMDVVTATAQATVNITPVVTAPEITVTPTSLSADLLPSSTITRSLTIANSGEADLDWSVFTAPFDCGNPGSLLWAAADLFEGTTPAGGVDEVVVTFSSTGSSPGNLEGLLCVVSNDADEPVVPVPLNLTIVEVVRNLLPVIVRP